MDRIDEHRVLAIGQWAALLDQQNQAALAEVLPSYLMAQRWFGGKARQIKAAHITGAVSIPGMDEQVYLSLVQVDYAEGAGQIYVLPLAFAAGDQARRLLAERPVAIVARLTLKDTGAEGVLYDALVEPALCQALLAVIAGQRQLKDAEGELIPSTTRAFTRLVGNSSLPLVPRIVNAEQSNTSVVYGDQVILKLFRRLEDGINPDLEIGRFLTERTDFAHIPPVAGALEYQQGGKRMTLAILQGFVPNQGDAWRYTLESLEHYFTRVMALGGLPPMERAIPQQSMLELADQPLPPQAPELLGGYLEMVRLLGQRTAELHRALASDPHDPSFAPEPFSDSFQHAFHDASVSAAQQAFTLLRASLDRLPAAAQQDARTLLEHENAVLERFQPLLQHPLTALRIRCHGDYHLGQVLFTGQDFFIIDFEGEPARPLSERRSKSSALQDVAGMLRSLHYASYAALLGQQVRAGMEQEAAGALDGWARAWHRWASSAFLQGYVAGSGQAPFLPQTRPELQMLLDIYLLDKAIYELVYELNNRPSWVTIPLQGILQLLEAAG